MLDKLELALYVFLNSPKTIWALSWELPSLPSIWIGEHYAANLHLHGHMKVLEGSVGHKIIRRYDKGAFVALIGFWSLAIKCYRNDWKRLL